MAASRRSLQFGPPKEGTQKSIGPVREFGGSGPEKVLIKLGAGTDVEKQGQSQSVEDLPANSRVVI